MEVTASQATPAGSPPKTSLPSKGSLPPRLHLRADLVWHTTGPNVGECVLEDPANGKFYRLGTMEQLFFEYLVECQSPEEASGRIEDSFPEHAWDTAKATKLCHWLHANGLIEDGKPRKPATAPRTSALGQFFFCKFSLVNPDRMLTGLIQKLGWLFDWKFAVAGFVSLLIAIVCMAGHWERFMLGYESLFVSHRWLSLGVAWFVLKIIHEIGHGATCRRYGCEVRDCGIAMILFMPIAYVDVTASWRLARWQRLQVTLAGVAMELAVASLALFVWLSTDSLIVQQIAADVVFLASVSSLLFNLNPLLKFDGYFALADLSGVDNLYQYGQRYAQYFGSRYILGLSASPPKLPGQHTAWIKVYGTAAACYRTVTVTGLITGAALIFHGAGIVIAIFGCVMFVGLPVFKLGLHLFKLYVAGELYPVRFAARLLLLTASLMALLFSIPVNWTLTSPGVVQYDPPAILRAPVAGFVETIHVHDGQIVEANQPILTLRNEELQLSWLALKKDVVLAEQEIQAARFTRELSVLNDAESKCMGLRKQLAELEEKKGGLIVRAPAAGRLVARNIELLAGRHLHESDEIGEIGDESRKRIKLSVSQTDASQLADKAHKELRVIVPYQSAFVASLNRLETRASDKTPDPSLSSINGGTLAVIHYGDGEATLCEPRTTGYIALDSAHSHRLRSGQRVAVSLATGHQSVAHWLWARVRDALR